MPAGALLLSKHYARLICSWMKGLTTFYTILFLLTLGVVSRFAFLFIFHIHPTIEFAELENIARSLATIGVFGNPYTIPTGPTAHHAPLYPFLLSLVFRTLGYGGRAAFVMAAMNIFFGALQYALLPVLTDTAGIHRVVGVTAGFIGALLPYRIMREIRWETTLSALFIVILAIVTVSWWRYLKSSAIHTFLVGVTWGAAMLCCPVLLPVFFLFLLFFGVHARRANYPTWLVPIAVATLGMILAVVPWTIRNYKELGALIFIRSNLGLELDLSNNSEAHVLFADNIAIGYPNNYYHLHHPWASPRQAERVKQMGEVAFNRECLHRALSWIRSHPRDFARLTFERMVFFWFTPPRTQAVKMILLMPWTAVAAWGLWIALHRHPPLGLLLLSIWIAYPLIYYLVQTDARYRYPIDWTFALLSVYALTKPLWEAQFPKRDGFVQVDLRR